MTKIFEDESQVNIFLDDILVFNESEEDHLKTLNRVLDRLKTNGVLINYNKSRFGVGQVKYLRYIIEAGKVKPDISNMNTDIFNRAPKRLKELRALLGYINWFRPYLMNLSDLVSPLTEKLKEVEFSWSDQDSNLLKEILNIIMKQPELNLSGLSKDFELHCDSSNKAIGSVLIQENKIIRIFSMKLNSAQRKYTTTELECFAMVVSLQKFRIFF